jgi:hypothetical protein
MEPRDREVSHAVNTKGQAEGAMPSEKRPPLPFFNGILSNIAHFPKLSMYFHGLIAAFP